MAPPASRPRADRSPDNAAQGQFISSNETANMFLGSRRRSYGWMDPSPGLQSPPDSQQTSPRPCVALSTSASLPKKRKQLQPKPSPPVPPEGRLPGEIVLPLLVDQPNANPTPPNSKKRGSAFQNPKLPKRQRSAGSASVSMSTSVSPSISHHLENTQSGRSSQTPASELSTRDSLTARDEQYRNPSEEARPHIVRDHSTQPTQLPPGPLGEASSTLDTVPAAEQQQALHQGPGHFIPPVSPALSQPQRAIPRLSKSRSVQTFTPRPIQPRQAVPSPSITFTSEYRAQSQHPHHQERNQGGPSSYNQADYQQAALAGPPLRHVPLSPALVQQINFFHSEYPTASPYFTTNSGPKFEALMQHHTLQYPPPQPYNRADMIRVAIQLNDHLFLVVHQVFCLFVSMQDHVPQPLQTVSLIPAMRVLDQLFDQAEPLPGGMGLEFCHFPVSLPEFAHSFLELYQTTVTAVNTFFRLLVNWHSFKRLCLERRYPPLVGELITVLGITSPVLMEVVHIACVASLWGPKDAVSTPFVDMARDTYYENAKAFLLPKNRDLASFCDTEEAIFISQYLSLDKGLENVRNSAATGAPAWGLPVAGLQNVPLQPNQPPVYLGASNSLALGPRAASQPSHGSHFAVPSNQMSVSSQQMHNPGISTLPTAFPFVPQYWDPSAAVQGTNFAQREQPAASNYSPMIHANVAYHNHFIPGTGTSHLGTHSLQDALTGPLVSPNQASQPFIRSASLQVGPHPVLSTSQQVSTAQPQLLIPQPGWRLRVSRLQSYQTSALHQAHLMSPVLAPIDLSPMARDATLYQVVKSLTIAPHRLNHTNDVIHFLEFELSADEFARVARTKSHGMLSAARLLGADSCQYRVRCCTLPSKQGTGTISDLEWSGFDTSFPGFATWRMNDTYLEIRRKPHFTKDRPVDVTDMLKQGRNCLEVYLNVDFNDKKRALYAVALECVGGMTIEAIEESITANSVGESDIVASLTSSLSKPPKSSEASIGAAEDSDDDVIMIAETRTIGVRDPISLTTLGRRPVRGLNCKHHECFDLDNFLQSRPRNSLPDNKFKTLPLSSIRTTSPDDWKCPICKLDVRPSNLGLDLWMLNVRNELDKTGQLDAERIVVQCDGSWTVKPENIPPSTPKTKRDNTILSAATSDHKSELPIELSPDNRITDHAFTLDNMK